MSNTAPSRADPVVVFPLGRWCPPLETSQPHPPPREPGASTVLTKCWIWELMLETNFGNSCTKGHHSWWPKFLLPTLVLYQAYKEVNTYWNWSQDWPLETTFFSVGLVPLSVFVATSAGWPLRSLAVSEAVVSASLASLVILLSNDLVLVLKKKKSQDIILILISPYHAELILGNKKYTVKPYNTMIFLKKNTQKRHFIGHQWGWGMECPLWDYILRMSTLLYWYCFIRDHVMRRFLCIDTLQSFLKINWVADWI